jgi:hypothetical protein
VSTRRLGAFKPTDEDFTMLRLALLALLPQIGGVLLMVGIGPCGWKLNPGTA